MSGDHARQMRCLACRSDDDLKAIFTRICRKRRDLLRRSVRTRHMDLDLDLHSMQDIHASLQGLPIAL